MKFRVVIHAWWMFWAHGMVMWPWMWIRKPEYLKSDRLFRHELEHCYRLKRMGWLKFYGSYIWLRVRHGYSQHPYELEAKAVEQTPLTAQEQAWRKRRMIRL